MRRFAKRSATDLEPMRLPANQLLGSYTGRTEQADCARCVDQVAARTLIAGKIYRLIEQVCQLRGDVACGQYFRTGDVQGNRGRCRVLQSE